MVADAIMYHPTVTHYLKLVGTTVGRDKLLRTVQYFSRFYVWYLLRLNATPAEVAPFEAIKKQFSFIRKGMRLGKWLEHLKAASVAVDATSMDPFVRFCTIGRQMGYAGYLTLDNLNFLDSAGIRKSVHAKARGQMAYKSWFTGISFSILCSVYKLLQLRVRESAVDKNSAESAVESKKLEKERAAASKQLLCDMCDITSPALALGYAPFLDEGMVGIAGTVSSIIGLQNAWNKCA